jgi:hypothetical protein
VPNGKIVLVGDNPFHGISHLSQDQAIARGANVLNPESASILVRTALDNGADGFMFSVSDTTLAILRLALTGRPEKSVKLYAIVPYVFEFVRMAVTEGGIPGLSKKVGLEIVRSANFGAVFYGLKGLIGLDPASLLQAYLLYEESRIKKAAGKAGVLSTIFLHEVLTDMSLGLNMQWVFKTHINFSNKRGLKPGFHTHQLPSLVERFDKWNIDTRNCAFTTQFNSLGFGMCPSREECEKTLTLLKDSEVYAYGILASGYLNVEKAISYIKTLDNLTGVAVGISKEQQAKETIVKIREYLHP